MHYQEPYIFRENLGNNALSYAEREQFWTLHGKKPELVIPKRIVGDISDVKISKNIAFEEYADGKIISCVGLENFVEIRRDDMPPIIVFDNHNHALYFWCEAIQRGIIDPGFELLHIDEHSDLWDNEYEISDFSNLDEIWHFTNFSCNVGNYIVPAQKAGIVGKMIRIENEFQIDENMDFIPSENSVLNLDLDIFSPEMAHIPPLKTINLIKNLLKRVKYVTICTSPYFIEQ